MNRYYIGFLDETLRAHKDNILQEYLFIVVTSMEMITLCLATAILPLKCVCPCIGFQVTLTGWGSVDMTGQ